MVKIRPSLLRDSFRPQRSWPEDCFVQWGGRGLVLSGEKSYNTAFFEAFPEGLGFIRGEGATITEAEDAAFGKYQRQSVCPGHEWSRRGYTNGYAFCRHCGCGKSAMKPIVKLGDWRAPLSSWELEQLVDGGLLAWEDRDGAYHPPRDRTRLRARLFGLDLPPIPREPVDLLEAENHPHTRECQDIVFNILREHGGEEGINMLIQDTEADKRGMAGIFTGMSLSSVKWTYKRWLEEKSSYEEIPDGP